MYILAILAVSAGVLYYWSVSRTRSKSPLPPGPFPLPLLGNALQIGKLPHLSFMQWAKKYGPIFRIKIGPMNAIVLSDKKLIKELFSDYASTGRMTVNPVVYEFAKGPNGVINSEGKHWEEQRKFMLRTLQNFGFFRTSMEGLIADEVHAMLEWFKKNQGTPISGSSLFIAPVVNAVWRITSGERCQWEQRRHSILDKLDDFFTTVNIVCTNGVLFAPFLRYIAPEFFGWNRYVKAVDGMMEVFNETVKKHKDTFDPNNLRDFIDHFLLEIENTKDSESSFSAKNGHEHLIASCFDLFLGGSETTSNTLSWALLYLSHYQEIQKKLQKEIDQVCGSSFPSLSNKPNLPYAEAVILEVQRLATPVTLGVPHCMKSDLTFHGYLLPKGAPVFANLYAAHHDPKIWGDPLNFRPERFLNEDGTKKMNCEENLASFSEGKRKCIGEILARNTMFLFVTGIFQQFNVSPNPGEKTDLLAVKPGLLISPKAFKVVMSPRNYT